MSNQVDVDLLFFIVISWRNVNDAVFRDEEGNNLLSTWNNHRKTWKKKEKSKSDIAILIWMSYQSSSCRHVLVFSSPLLFMLKLTFKMKFWRNNISPWHENIVQILGKPMIWVKYARVCIYFVYYSRHFHS